MWLYLDLCQTYCLWKIVLDYIYFCWTLFLRTFHMFGRILNTPMYLYVLLKFCFRHVQPYSSIIQEHAYSEASVSLACSKNILRLYGMFIIPYKFISVFSQKLNLGLMIQFWMSLFFIDAMSFLEQLNSTFNVIRIQAYSRLIQPHLVLLSHVKNPGIFKDILLQPFSRIL